MSKIIFFLESLEKRERLVLIIGIYFLIIVGFFLIPLLYLSINVEILEEKIKKEQMKYMELKKLVEKYKVLKPKGQSISLSLSIVDKIVKESELENNIVSIIPTQDGIEVSMEDVKPDRFFDFLKKVKEKGFFVLSVSINDPKGDNKLDVRLLIGESI